MSLDDNEYKTLLGVEVSEAFVDFGENSGSHTFDCFEDRDSRQ